MATRRILNLYLLRLRLQKLLSLSLSFSVFSPLRLSPCAGQRYISIYCRQQQHGHSPRGRRGRGQLEVAQQRQPTSRPAPLPAAAGRPAARPRPPATGPGISAASTASWLRTNLRTSNVACVCVRVSLCESWPQSRAIRSSHFARTAAGALATHSAQLSANSFSARYTVSGVY